MMASRPIVVDAGVGNIGAEPGTVPWAQAVRLELQFAIHQLPTAPATAVAYLEAIKKHRAWTLMNKPDGSTFSTFEDFCGFREPWGLGRPFEEIQPYLEAAMGKRTLALVAVAPDARRENGSDQARDEKGRVLPKETVSPHDEGKRSATHATTERLRAVLRAPEPVQELYRAGLIGQVDAARLGKRDPKPEDAAKAVDVAREAVALVKARAPKTVAEKKKVQREVNQLVRARVDVPAPKTPVPVAAPEPDSAPAAVDERAVVRALPHLTAESLVRVMRTAQTLLMARGATVSLQIESAS